MKNNTLKATTAMFMMALISGNILATNFNIVPAKELLRNFRRNAGRRMEILIEGREGCDE